MAEKRVSVRLVAEGGRQVRAELEGIGEAGTRGFGRLSSEMELANARLGSFARKAGIALAAVTAAAAAAGVAMVRSGLDVIGAQADMAASLKTTVESLQVLTWPDADCGGGMGGQGPAGELRQSRPHRKPHDGRDRKRPQPGRSGGGASGDCRRDPDETLRHGCRSGRCGGISGIE